jgi:hypothetical protein
MKTVSHPLFLGIFLIYLVYYTLKSLQIQMPEFVTSYVADLLSLFIVNTFVLWLIRLVKSNKNLELTPLMIFLSFILFTGFFEFYLPTVNGYYHRDYLDIACYGISAFGFILWRRKKRSLK